MVRSNYFLHRVNGIVYTVSPPGAWYSVAEYGGGYSIGMYRHLLVVVKAGKGAISVLTKLKCGARHFLTNVT
jgi:hypothetical protein